MGSFILSDRYADPASGRISSYFSRLFILTGNGYFRYGLLDTEKNSVLSIADYRMENVPKNQGQLQEEFAKLIANDEILVKKYPSVIIGIDSPYHTLIPETFYSAEQSEAYFSLNFKMPEQMITLADNISEVDAVNLAAIPGNLSNWLSVSFPGAVLVPGSSAMIRSFFLHNKNNPSESTIYLSVKSHSIDLAHFSGSKLVFYNSFLCESKEDVLYFTLNLAEQLSLDPGQLNLNLCGSVDEGSELYLLLSKYISSIHFIDDFTTLNFRIQSSKKAVRIYQDLLGLTLCGS